MPPLVFHMAFARQLELRLGRTVVRDNLGPFLLGATSPDIRVLTRWDRRDTHYFDFDEFEHQDSVAKFFAQHPELADPAKVCAETAAFVAGYTTHLTLDERWIVEIFRAFFGERSPLGGTTEAHLFDRLLQYELDRRKREDAELISGIKMAMDDAEAAVDCGFIDADTLHQWRELAADQLQYPPDYDRLRYYSGRQLRAHGIDPEIPAEFDLFLERVPELLDAALNHVTPERFDAFVEQSYDSALAVVEAYLR